ncbi:MAG: hypothetical protein HGN29_09280 [Asgard group archaeon]|nr:hypothetical protein [Asgard group archaeon]
MDKLLEKLLIASILIQLLILPNVFVAIGDQPVIASRIAEISEIAIIDQNYRSSSTLFGIKTDVEILNRGEENQTITESVELIPKIFINVSFVDKSLKLISLVWCHDMFMHYSYAPGITVEYEFIQFHINQTDLTQLPDGNYTLWRPIPINTDVRLGNVIGEAFPTVINVDGGILTIIYHSFYYTYPEEVNTESNNTENNGTDETNFSLAFPLVCISILSYASTVYSRRRSRIS